VIIDFAAARARLRPGEELLTVALLADRLDRSPAAVRRMVAEGLPCRRAGGRLLFHPADSEAWVRAREAA
jgi:hypothetical protein